MAKEKNPNSIDALQDKIRKKKSPICLTLAPTAGDIPDFLKENAQPEEYVYEFGKNILEKSAELVPAVSFKVPAFETFGWQGMKAMSRLMGFARNLGMYVIADAMKAEVLDGVPMVQSAYLADGDFSCDCITLNGYGGSEAIKPYIEYCQEHDKAVFVMMKSPNSTCREFQELVAGDRFVYNIIGDLVQRLAKKTVGKWGYSLAGGIYAPAYSHDISEIRSRYQDCFILIPEFGGQGGNIYDSRGAFDRMGHGAMVASQASICGSWNSLGLEPQAYAEAVVQVLEKIKGDVASYVTVI